jgi:lipoprotein-anchoring transpeptidase ErfK/SrfK
MRMRILIAAVIAGGAALGFTAAQAETRLFFDPVTNGIIEARVGDDGRIINAALPGSRSNPIPRETIDYSGPYGPNTIVVNTTERRLYYIYEQGKAIRYGVGVGREGFAWSGTHRVTRKAEWPGWTPPPAMRRRQPELPAYMPGGIDNPLGARALYIGSTLYRIHGSNQPWTIGQAVSSGCIRMTNEDVTHLYDMVNVGTRVVVLR